MKLVKSIWLRRLGMVKQWHKVKDYQSPIGKDTIDETFHLKNAPATEDILSAEGEPVKVNNGDTRKVVQRIGKNTVVYKPYHSRHDEHTKPWVKYPIHGWATMATKAIYNAADIGKMSEDVSASSVDGVPITVHNFNADFSTVGDVLKKDKIPDGDPISKTPSPLQVQQISLLDYLTGNLDRNYGNILMSDNPNETGHHDLLSVDHDKNFQYQKQIGPKEIPHSYSNAPGIDQLKKATYRFGDNEALKNWWTSVSSNIKNEFYNQLSSVKHEKLRKFIENNFMERFNIIDEWSQDGEHQHSNSVTDLFSEDFPKPAVLHKIEKAPKEVVDFLLQRLPQNPLAALMAISRSMKKKRNTKTQEGLTAVFEYLFSQLNQQQKLYLFRIGQEQELYGPSGQKLWYEILNYSDNDFLRILLQKDKEEEFLLPQWRNKIKEKLNEDSHQIPLETR